MICLYQGCTKKGFHGIYFCDDLLGKYCLEHSETIKDSFMNRQGIMKKTTITEHPQLRTINKKRVYPSDTFVLKDVIKR